MQDSLTVLECTLQSFTIGSSASVVAGQSVVTSCRGHQFSEFSGRPAVAIDSSPARRTLVCIVSLLRLSSGQFLALCCLAGIALAGGTLQAQEKITTRQDKVGQMLNQWAAEKTAAGLAHIAYENRDGQHSPLEQHLYPQLKFVPPPAEEAAKGQDKGPIGAVRAQPTVGNCSMSAPADQGGSLPRLYFTNPGGLMFLSQQYVSNNLFIYPEHQDHDPGGNGVDGWGDLYPANSAALLISQGSSLSDQPFLRAVLSTIAAFDPDVQTELIRKRLLMPTVQAILRQSYGTVKTEADYFTGAAHPVVFDAALLDEEKMIIAAHTMRRPAVPPVVVLKVLKESEARPGRDFFEGKNITSQALADGPTTIARVFRTNDEVYEMIVAAQGGADLLNRPVSVRWQLLRGDPRLVSISRDEATGAARIRVRWHPPLAGEGGIVSHRVDIGVFGSNGVATSAPAFVTFYMLPSEHRSFDDKGRVSEIYYETPNPHLGLPARDSDPRWLDVLRTIVTKGDGLRTRLVERAFSNSHRAEMEKIFLDLSPRKARLDELVKTEAKDPAAKTEADRIRASLDKDLSAAMQRLLPGEAALPLKSVIARGFGIIADFTGLYPNFQREIDVMARQSPKPAADADLRAAVKRLIDLGIMIQEASGPVSTVRGLDALRSGEVHQLRCLNLTLMSQILFPEALARSTAPAYVDRRLTTPKPWRDVYRYDDKGALMGWIRYFQGRTTIFNADGEILPEGFSPSAKSAEAVYEQDDKGNLTFRAK